jgi:hypothetical protein
MSKFQKKVDESSIRGVIEGSSSVKKFLGDSRVSGLLVEIAICIIAKVIEKNYISKGK